MLILHNARQLVTAAPTGQKDDLGVLENTSVIIEGDRIISILPSSEVRPRVGDTVIDCANQIILPGFVDSHTHAVFAGVRADEFAMRVAGKSYQEIAEAGGGINNSVRAVRAATLDELVNVSRPRLDAALRSGTTTIEIKSGYGLDTENEIKLLEAARAVADESPIEVHTTFLGAHAVPPEFQGRQSDYVKYIISDMLPAIAARDLAESCDVFCDQGYFTVDESEKILAAAKKLGLRAKVHADELAETGGAEMAARVGALSADHLLCVSDDGIAALRDAGVVATLLPGTAYFLGLPYAPARRLLDAGCTVALASDFNPGSSPTSNMQMIISLACTQMKMTIGEAITGATLNGAKALGLVENIGSIEIGKQADMLVCDIEDYREMGYWFGGNVVSTVVKRGVVLE